MERKKKKKSRECSYSKETFDKALKDIRDNDIPIRAVARKYKIPRSTLLDRVSKQRFDASVRKGPIPVIGVDGEKELVEWLIHISKCGFQIKKTEILNTAQQLINENLIPNKFKNGRPGITWYKAFLNRNKEIASLLIESTRNTKAKATEQSLRLWFYELEAFLEHKNMIGILEHPENIFNLDESSFLFNPETEEVLGPKALRNLFKSKTGEELDLSVLVVSNANGDLPPPCISFPYSLPPNKVLEKMPQDWCLGNSDSDWTKSFVFSEYITNNFNTWIESNNVQKPVLLLVNGQKSHLTLQLCALCEELQIILYAIPANVKHILRPADASIFGPLKKNWNRTVKDFLDRSQGFDVTITKTNFCQLLQDTLLIDDLASSISSEFEKCGLYPFDPDALDYSKCFERPLS